MSTYAVEPAKSSTSPAVTPRRQVPGRSTIMIGSATDPAEHEAERVAGELAAVQARGTLRRCSCAGDAGPNGECAEGEARRLERKAAARGPSTAAPIAQVGYDIGLAGGRSPSGPNAVLAQQHVSLSRDTARPTAITAPPVVERTLATPGRPLDPCSRASFEPSFGADLSTVRIHDDTNAAASADAVNANAYAVGNHIVFATGRHRPGTPDGDHLLAHELTHVLHHVAQQTHAGAPLLQRQPKPNTEPWLTQVDDILPRKVGLLVHMDRIGQLTDRFTTNQLNELIGLIHANPDATIFTRDEAGLPGVFALQDTRIGNRLDVAAARFLLNRFPAHPPTPRKSDEKKAEVFSEQVVRDAYIRFHYNAILPEKDDPVPADLPNEIRQNCIAIVHALAPQLFTNESVVRKIEKRFKKLREKPETYTMVHTGEALVGIGVADSLDPIKFKDAAGKTTNGDTEPTTLASSAWDKVLDKVGNDFGWHIFAMAIMDGHHSVTLFVDNQPEGKALYWADQWRIDPGDDFFELPGAISGFRQYEKAGFDKFIEEKTNQWWKDVHRPDSKCGKAKGHKWDSGCRYSATLKLWQLRKVVQR